MNSCVASCCTYFRKVSCASATSASWPIANVPPPCHFPSNCSAGHRKPSKRPPPPVRAIFGLVPSVVGRWWSSKDSPLLKSNFVLHRWSRLRHEATRSNSKVFSHALRTSVPSLGTDVLFQLFDHATHDPFSHSASFRPHRVTCRALQHSLSTARRRSFPPLNLHRARVRRKSRATSFKSLNRKRAHTPGSVHALPPRASDSTLRLIVTDRPNRGNFRFANNPAAIL